ncbi:AIR synthase family protein [Velocimicrobium porci]|uniref:Hydrogenase maturation factor n=1 Tax=Velocimicrobium porci TaxID=2606634 RepID=A0A6L5Y166_9FIRM|nr:AIR synthase family protein [Velocimicrobium porci]MSS64148.1 hydrogenase maturation factor [Velocimicrobium porci]
MKIGKVPETVLKRSIFKQIQHRREEVLVTPGVGKDCSIIGLEEDEAIVLSTDPITGTANEIGKLAVHITANDIASSGAELIGIMLTIILPDGARESDLREMMQEIEGVCKKLNIEVLGGHTEVAAAVNQPIVTVTGVGKIRKNEITTTAGIKPSDELVMTKWAGLEGTAILATDKEEELLTKYNKDFIQGGKDMINFISVVNDAKIAKSVGASAMHDITEGGIFGALWEIASSSNLGVTVDLKKIPIKQETIEICEFFDLNPYMLMSSGCLLIATPRGNEMVDKLEREGIPAAVIGRFTKGSERVVLNEDEKRYLEPPKTDELYKAY